MGYCIDDLCHNGDPICGAASPYHCQMPGSGLPVDHFCGGCEECGWDDDDDDDDDASASSSDLPD